MGMVGEGRGEIGKESCQIIMTVYVNKILKIPNSLILQADIT